MFRIRSSLETNSSCDGQSWELIIINNLPFDKLETKKKTSFTDWNKAWLKFRTISHEKAAVPRSTFTNEPIRSSNYSN